MSDKISSYSSEEAEWLNKMTKHPDSYIHKNEEVDKEIQKNWESIWENICVNQNGLNLAQIKKELYDYSNLMDRMSELTDYISNGLLSKPNYTINVLKSQVDDGIRKGQEEFRKDIIGLLKSHDIDKKIIHEINSL